MATFAAKYLVSGVSKQLSLESLNKLDFERVEKELGNEDTQRKKKHAKMELERKQVREDIREKYGINPRKAHDPVHSRSGLLVIQSEKDVLLQEEDEDSDCCTPCCSCFPSLSSLFKSETKSL